MSATQLGRFEHRKLQQAHFSSLVSLASRPWYMVYTSCEGPLDMMTVTDHMTPMPGGGHPKAAA